MSQENRSPEAIRILIKSYADLQCSGVVKLIEYLSSPGLESLISIGSSTMGLAGIMNEVFLTERARLLSAERRVWKLHIGSGDGSITPLEWLGQLAQDFGNLSPLVRERFDLFCTELVEFSEAKPVGMVELYSRQGTFHIPAEQFKRRLSDEELEPYRVPQSQIFSNDPE